MRVEGGLIERVGLMKHELGVLVTGELNVGWKLSTANGSIIFYNVHLTAYPYPPYALHCDGKSASEAEAIERETQLPWLLDVLNEMDRHREQLPTASVFLTGAQKYLALVFFFTVLSRSVLFITVQGIVLCIDVY